MVKTMAKAEVNISKLTRDCTLYLTMNFTKGFKARLMVATGLIKTAEWILGCNIEIENSEKE